MSKPKRPELAQTKLVDQLPVACASETAAIEFFELNRWGTDEKEVPCPHCGCVGNCYKMRDRATGERNKKYLWRCRDCGKMFTVRTGTVYAESLIPMHKWCRAMWECASAKNGCSALELARRIQVTYKTALFLLHRIRHGMAPSGPQPKLTGTIEADELYWGGRARHPRIIRGAARPGPNPDKPKQAIFAVVQRGGEVRARPLPAVNSGNVREALLNMAEPSCRLITDDLKAYWRIGRPFARHDRVNHTRREYVNKDDPTTHTNTVESFFARVRRQLSGTYHNVSREHLHRYLHHAAFLYNTRGMNDGQRVEALLKGFQGKRLMYRDPVDPQPEGPKPGEQLPPFPEAQQKTA